MLNQNISIKKESNLNLNCNFKLDLKTIHHLKSPLSYSEMTNLFNDWKFKVEKFKLLIEINHSKNGFNWSDRSFLQQNREFFDKLDFMKYDKSMIPKNSAKETKFSEMMTQRNNFDTNSNNKTVSNFNLLEKKFSNNKKIKLYKKSSRNLSSKIKKLIDRNLNSTLTSFSATDCIKSNDHIISNEIAYIPSSISSLNSSSSESNHTMIYVKQNGSIYNENRCFSTIHMLNNNEVLTGPNINNTSMNCNVTNINISSNINLTELINIPQDMSLSNCSYLNLFNSSFTSSAFFNQNDLNVPQCIVDSTVEELLNNDLRAENEISNEHEKFMYFQI